MKVSYILDRYDVIFQQTISPTIFSNKTIAEELTSNEQKSYRIFEIEIHPIKKGNNLSVCKKTHSLLPQVEVGELKSIIYYNEYLEYIPELKSIIDLTGEPIFIAKNKYCHNKFFVYEKCSITEIPLNEQELIYTNLILQHENVAIIRAIKQQVFNSKSNVKIKHFIHKMQSALEAHLHVVLKHIDPKSKTELYQYSTAYDKIDCLKCQFYHLEKLLIFLEREYAAFLNDKSMVPYRTVLSDEVAIAAKLDCVKNSILAMVIDKELLQIIYKPLLVLSELQVQEKISHQQYKYSKNYLNKIFKFIKANPREISTIDWCHWLKEMNYNSFEFLDFFSGILKTECNNCATLVEALDLMFFHLKEFNQSKSKTTLPYNQKLPSIENQVIGWIEEEIIYLNRKKSITKEIVVPKEVEDDNEKLQLGISVPQLAFMIRIMIEAGTIRNTSTKEVIRIFSKICKTEKAENISYDSLRAKYYNIENSASEAVQKRIEKHLELSKQ
ncbi:hypothetical protein [Flavobacterium succinicans]|nr:hypothetical protein [Flavobacterium succinicans]